MPEGICGAHREGEQGRDDLFGGLRLILAEADALAAELKALLEPFCVRCEIAGGIRRRKKEPHDIEIVCIPLFTPTTVITPLGTYIEEPPINMLNGRILKMIADGGLARGDPDKAGKRAPCGPRYYRLRYKGEKLDLFVVIPPAQWGAVLTIRTGDADYSHWLVQQGWPNHIIETNGHLERTTRDDNSRTPHIEILQTPEEEDFFKALGVPMLAPELRDYNATRAEQIKA